MALTNIEYGSLASSDTINNNFLYLDDRITNTAQDIMGSISSILSNIATINGRLTDLAESIRDNNADLNSKLDDYKTKTKQLVGLVSMVPNWGNCVALENITSYTASTNGYLLVVAKSDSYGDITINDKTFVFKQRKNAYDNVSQMTVLPILKGDVCVCNIEMSYIYFLPVKSVSIANF